MEIVNWELRTTSLFSLSTYIYFSSILFHSFCIFEFYDGFGFYMSSFVHSCFKRSYDMNADVIENLEYCLY